MADSLATLARHRHAQLTSYKRDGTPIGTPVWFAVEGDRVFVRAGRSTWKWRRVRNVPECELAPSTMRGKEKGDAIPLRGRILEGAEADHASRVLRRRYKIGHGVLVPLAHKLMRTDAVHMELVPR